jgi:hypothetical protein
VDFKKVLNVFISYRLRGKLPSSYLMILKALYASNLEKKKKLKSGVINFKEKRIYYGDTVIFY